MKLEIDIQSALKLATAQELSAIRDECDKRLREINGLPLTIAEEKNLLNHHDRNGLISTIKMLRDRTGCGLLEGKMACEAVLAANGRV